MCLLNNKIGIYLFGMQCITYCHTTPFGSYREQCRFDLEHLWNVQINFIIRQLQGNKTSNTQIHQSQILYNLMTVYITMIAIKMEAIKLHIKILDLQH